MVRPGGAASLITPPRLVPLPPLWNHSFQREQWFPIFVFQGCRYFYFNECEASYIKQSFTSCGRPCSLAALHQHPPAGMPSRDGPKSHWGLQSGLKAMHKAVVLLQGSLTRYCTQVLSVIDFTAIILLLTYDYWPTHCHIFYYEFYISFYYLTDRFTESYIE